MRATGSAHRQRPRPLWCARLLLLLSGRIYAMVVRPRLAVTPLITAVTQGVVLWCMICLHAERADYGEEMRNVRVAVVEECTKKRDVKKIFFLRSYI